MKLAYLILAYKNSQQLERVISRLQGSETHFFIHIDKKFDIEPFLYISNKWNNVEFVEERYKVFHRGYASINATLSLLKAAQKANVDYNILLSGSDYPIKSNQYIEQFLVENNGKEFISFFNLHHRPKWLKKVEQYFFWDSVFTQFNGGVEPVSRRIQRLQKRSSKRIPRRKFLEGMKPYGGSQWWMLTNDCARYVIQYIEGNRQFRRFFRFTDVPNELVFQTVILNSPFAKNVINWSEYQNEKKRTKLLGTWPCPASVYNFRYIDWSPDRQSGVGHPVILENQDFELLKNSPCLFARKVNSVKSRTLMQRIDDELLDTAHDEDILLKKAG